MSVFDQAALFNSADVIVAAHGAGLSNLVFCEPGTLVLEIFPENYSTGNFFSIASALDLEYFSAVGETIKVEGAKHIRDHDVAASEKIISNFLS
jgi:capsular polysaccharide biosynthesis protein